MEKKWRGERTVARAILVAGLSLFCTAARVDAQNQVTAGQLALNSTFDSISVRAAYSGDANANASAQLRFRPAGSTTWLDAYAPPADRRATVAGQANPYRDQFRGSIVGLAAGSTYEVMLTLSDPDGVVGSSTASGVVSTISSSPPLGGVDWYVDDVTANGVGTATSPFNSLVAGIAAAAPGDTIHVRPGIYPAFTIAKSGTPSAWISLVGDDRDTTIIAGGAVTNNITVNGDYLQIRNFRLRQTQNNSVDVTNSRHHIWLDNLYHEDVSSSHGYFDAGVLIRSATHHIYVLNNTILSPGLTATAPASPRWDSPGSGIGVSGDISPVGTFVFKGNTIIGGFRDCIGNSMEGFGGSTRDNTDIANNVISGCKDDGIQMEGDDINLRIWGNHITANNGYTAVAMSSSIVGPVYVFRNVLRVSWTGDSGMALKISNAAPSFYFHNTIDTSGANLRHDGFAGSMNGQVLLNNVIVTSANPLYCMGAGGGSRYDYNLYYRPSSGVIASRWNCVTGVDYNSIADFNNGTSQEAHGWSQNPLFTDQEGHVDSSSPVIDRGMTIPNFNDIHSAWPYYGTAPDVGSSETGGNSYANPPSNLRLIAD